MEKDSLGSEEIGEVLTECELTYNHTGHEITVWDRASNHKVLHVWRVTDVPPDFKFSEGCAITINNPNGLVHEFPEDPDD